MSSPVDGPRFARSFHFARSSPSIASRRLTFEAETLLYTLSEVNIARDIEEELGSVERLPEQNRTAFSSISEPPVTPTAGLLHPPDGGYGWFVTLGSFMSHMVEGCLERGEGIFLLHFKQFGMPVAVNTLPGATSSTLRFLLSPVASMLCNRYSIRASVMLGAVVFTTGMFLAQFATTFPVLFLTFGVLSGCGRALFSGPALIIIGLYFRKRQGVASGIAASGVGCGAFLLVPLVQILFDVYGFSGAFLIMSAIVSHMILVAMLYRPLSTNQRYLDLDAKKKLQEKTEYDKPNNSATIVPLHLKRGLETAQEATGFEQRPGKGSLSSEVNQLDEAGIMKLYKSSCCRKCWSRLCDTCCCQICFPVEVFNKNHAQDPEAHVFQCHLLKHHAFFFYCLTIFLFTIGFKVYYVFLPSLMKAKGFTPKDATLVIATVGPIDTLSRIGIGVLVDMQSVRPYRMRLFNMFLVSLSVCSMVLPGVTSLPQIYAVMAVYSVCSGMCFATRTVVLVDLLGVRRLCNSFGILMFFQGVGTIIGTPVAGMLVDVYHTVTYGYYMAGAGMTLSALSMSMSIYWHESLKE